MIFLRHDRRKRFLDVLREYGANPAEMCLLNGYENAIVGVTADGQAIYNRDSFKLFFCLDNGFQLDEVSDEMIDAAFDSLTSKSTKKKPLLIYVFSDMDFDELIDAR